MNQRCWFEAIGWKGQIRRVSRCLWKEFRVWYERLEEGRELSIIFSWTVHSVCNIDLLVLADT